MLLCVVFVPGLFMHMYDVYSCICMTLGSFNSVKLLQPNGIVTDYVQGNVEKADSKIW